MIPADDPRVREGGEIYEKLIELGEIPPGEPYGPPVNHRFWHDAGNHRA
jgi:hypothetical protein